MERKFIDIRGTRIAYSDEGEGESVVFVHGFGTFSFTWHYLLEELVKLKIQKRYITLDLKGFGYSAKPNNNKYTPYDQARSLKNFINRLSLRNITLVGHSFGGGVILTMLLLLGARVLISKVILIDSAGYFQKLPSFIERLRIPILNRLMLYVSNSSLLFQWVLEDVFYDKTKIKKELVYEYAKILDLPKAQESLLRSAKKISLDDTLKLEKMFQKIDVPTLIIWGEKDRIIPLGYGYRFKRDIPNAQLAVIPRCGHAPQEECPKECAKFIAKFLKKKFSSP